MREFKNKIQRLLDEKNRLVTEIDSHKTQINNLRTEVQYVKTKPIRDPNLENEL